MSQIKVNEIKDLAGNSLIKKGEVEKVVDNLVDLLTVPTDAVKSVRVLNYHSDVEGGGGVFYWDADKDKDEHNGGTVIDPTVVYPADWDNQTQLGTWFDTANAGTGCWVRQYDGAVNVKWFGAISGNNTYASANQKAIDTISLLGLKPAMESGTTYHFPDGYDLWKNNFLAGDNVSAFIGASSFDVSGAINGLFAHRYTYNPGGATEFLSLRNLRSGGNVIRWADGENSSDAHLIRLPMESRRNSHGFILSTADNTGENDILFRNHTGADRFYIYQYANPADPRLLFTYNTLPTAPDGNDPAYAFDSAMTIPGNSRAKQVTFPSLGVNFQQFSNHTLRGSSFNRFRGEDGGNIKTGVSRRLSQLPFQQDFFRKSEDYDIYHLRGTFTATIVCSNGDLGHRRFDWVWAGGNITITNDDNTLPTGATASVSPVVGNTRLNITLLYSGPASDVSFTAETTFTVSQIAAE